MLPKEVSLAAPLQYTGAGMMSYIAIGQKFKMQIYL